MLNKSKWDTLAQAAKWSRENGRVLVDTHWVGGDPTALEAYGWASWSKEKSILGLRNPSDKPQRFYLDLSKALEIPQGEAAQFTLKSIYGNNSTLPEKYQEATVITLQPLETLVLEANPVK